MIVLQRSWSVVLVHHGSADNACVDFGVCGVRFSYRYRYLNSSKVLCSALFMSRGGVESSLNDKNRIRVHTTYHDNGFVQ